MADGQFWTVEKILKTRVNKQGQKEYRIKWKGWASKWNSWEPESNLRHPDLMLAETSENPDTCKNQVSASFVSNLHTTVFGDVVSADLAASQPFVNLTDLAASQPFDPDEPDDPDEPGDPDKPEPDEPEVQEFLTLMKLVSDDPYKPEPDDPGEPDHPADDQEDPDNSDEPDDPDELYEPDDPDEPGDPDKSESDDPGEPDHPADDTDDPDNSDEPDDPDELYEPDDPDEPGDPDKPEPDEPEVEGSSDILTLMKLVSSTNTTTEHSGGLTYNLQHQYQDSKDQQKQDWPLLHEASVTLETQTSKQPLNTSISSDDDGPDNDDDDDYIPDSSTSDSEGSVVFDFLPLPMKYPKRKNDEYKERQGKGMTLKSKKRKINHQSETGYRKDRGENQEDTNSKCKDDTIRKTEHGTNDHQSDTGHSKEREENKDTNSKFKDEAISKTKSGTSTTGEKYKKPYRFCIFCLKLFSKLRKHIELIHLDNQRVKQALLLPKEQRDNAFDDFRREGIMLYNKQEAKANPDKPVLQRERKRPLNADSRSILVMCSICHAFIERKYRRRHELVHNKKTDSALSVDTVPATMLSSDLETVEGTYANDVLSKFRSDEVGLGCIKDEMLVKVGQMMFQRVKKKPNKKDEVRRNVMTDMRRLKTLHRELEKTEQKRGELPSKEGNICDLFKRTNFMHLLEAIENYTTSNSQLKSGLKLALYFLLKSTCKIIMGIHLINGSDSKSEEITRFLQVLEMHKHLSFGDASYQRSQIRENKLRRPQGHPQEEDIQTVKRYTCQRINDLMSEEIETGKYVELRDLLVCRLTLFNARRGGEPSGLFIKEWEEADAGAWLDERHVNQLDPIDKALLETMKVGYQSGKGQHLVSVLFPEDTHAPLRQLANREVRNRCCVDDKNKFLFPTVKGSSGHVSGWHAIQNVISKLDLKDKASITATKNRHRVSTEFAMLDLSPSDRQYIYKHLGHSEDTNQHVYQAPLAVRAITVVGKRLQTLDRELEDPDEDPTESYPVSAESDEVPQLIKSKASESNVSLPSKGKASGSNDVAPRSKRKAYESNDVAPRSEGKASEYNVSRLNKAAHVEGGAVSQSSSGRDYTHWTSKETEQVVEYFKKFITSEETRKLPGKKDIQKFLQNNPDFSLRDWIKIRSKVMNYKRKADKKMKSVTEGETAV